LEASKFKYKPDPYLAKLDKIFGANYEDATPSVFYLFPDAIANLWMVTSILATPYILWILFKLKKFGWILFFFLFTILPTWVGFNFITNDLIRSIFVYLPILNIAIYHILLKMTYPAWKEMMFFKEKID